jgi:hypothetical protein
LTVRSVRSGTATTAVALAPLAVDAAWSLTAVEEHPTEIGPLTVERYETVDLATGQRTVFHLAGDVVLAAAGVELKSLDAPPTFPRGVRGEAGPNGRRGVAGNLAQPLDRSRRQRVA